MFYNMYMILGVLALLSIGCSQGVVSTKQSKVDNIMNVFILVFILNVHFFAKHRLRLLAAMNAYCRRLLPGHTFFDFFNQINSTFFGAGFFFFHPQTISILATVSDDD